MADKTEKIMYFATHADDDPEKAAMPFVMASAALAMDMEAVVVLQGQGVYLARQGYADNVLTGGGFPPMRKLLDDFMALGGDLRVCVPCIKARNIDESELVEGSKTTAAGALNVEAVEADAVFVY